MALLTVVVTQPSTGYRSDSTVSKGVCDLVTFSISCHIQYCGWIHRSRGDSGSRTGNSHCSLLLLQEGQ